MASHLDAPDESTDSGEERAEDDDRIDVHLRSALDSSPDRARYHLREALQLQLAEMNGQS